MSKITTNVCLVNNKLAILFVLITTLSQCTTPKKQTEENIEYKQELSAKLYKVRNEDSLLIILKQFYEVKDDVGKMICYKHLGSLQRASSRYSDAIRNHKQGLAIALQLNDTIEIVQAMNNLGTDFRHIGAYNESSEQHYQALCYAEAWSGLYTPIGAKNHVIL